MSEEWAVQRGTGGIRYEWKGYTIVKGYTTVSARGVERWWIIQGQPATHKERFEYINDAKEACESAYRMEAR